MWILVFLLCLVPCSTLRAQAPAQSADEVAVRALIQQYVNARDARDEQALEALFTADIDQYTTSGQWRRGGRQVIAGTAQSSKQNPGARSIPPESVRFITHDVALVDGPYHIAGNDLQRWTTIVVKRESDGWRIAAIRNMAPTAGRSRGIR